MEVIQFLQQFDHPMILFLMKCFTFLGNELFYVLVLPVLIWCWDKEKTVPLLLIFFINFFINDALKTGFHIVRPEGTALINVTGYNFPSGHAQMAVVVWGYLAWTAKSYYGTAFVLSFFIGLSRIYLGVHTPTAVVGGWTIGFTVLLLSLVTVQYLREKKISFASFVTTFTIILISLVIAFLYVSDTWIRASGGFMGIVLGLAFEMRWVRFNPDNTTRNHIIKYLIGIIGIIVFKEGVKFLLPVGIFFTYVRYVAIGFWITGLAPLIFVKLGYSEK